MNKTNKRLLILVIILISFSIIANIYKTKEQVVEIEEIYMSMEFDNTIIAGFDANKTALTFGKIPLGSTSKRSFTVYNDLEFPIRIKIEKEGDISPYILISDASFNLDIAEEREIIVLATPAEGIEEKKYEGKLKIITTK